MSDVVEVEGGVEVSEERKVMSNIEQTNLEKLIEQLRTELADEQKAHEQIASLCFVVGAESSDGTSVAAVKSLVQQLAKAKEKLETLSNYVEDKLGFLNKDAHGAPYLIDAAVQRISELERAGAEYIARTDPLLACVNPSDEKPHCGTCRLCLIERAESADARVKELEAQVQQNLEHCHDSECSCCALIICPHKDPLHFHHDGCPSCSTETLT